MKHLLKVTYVYVSNKDEHKVSQLEEYIKDGQERKDY